MPQVKDIIQIKFGDMSLQIVQENKLRLLVLENKNLLVVFDVF